MVLILFGNAVELFADITAVTLQVEAPAVSPAKINGSAIVKLTANWTGDTPPFSATFKAGGSTLGTESTSGNSAILQVSGAVLGHGDSKIFEVVVLESSVPNAESQKANGNNAISVDLEAPQIDVEVTNGTNFSNTAPNNVVRIRVSSNEDIRKPTIAPINGVSAAQEGTDTFGKVFYFNLTLTAAFTNGSYNISATAKDTSEPLSGANTGSAAGSFSVGTTVTGNTVITSTTPASPTNATSITISGTAPNGAASIQILDNDTAVTSSNITTTNWSIGLSPDVGSHSYVAVSKDSLNQEISRSAAFPVIIDRAVPEKPAVVPASVPATTNQTSVNVSVDFPNIDTEVSKPLSIRVFKNGVAAGSPQSVSASPASINVALDDGMNSITFQATDASGNVSVMSDPISITKNSSSTSVNTTVSFESPFVMPLPVAQSYMVGGGVYKMKVVFDKDMATGTKPLINITAAGGAAITSSGGTWNTSRIFIGDFVIPKNGGESYNGAATLTVSGAKDAFGNDLEVFSQPDTAFYIDSSSPNSSFDVDTAIYVSETVTSVSLKGLVTDVGGSGIGYIDMIYQNFADGAIASKSVPIMAASPSPWSYNWDVTGLAAGRYKLWTAAADRANPAPNMEDYAAKPYRIVIVDKNVPVVTRIALDNMTVDINDMVPQPVVTASAVTRLTALISDDGDTGIAFGSADFVFTLKHDATNTPINGNYSNNASDTVYFDFPVLTVSGTYTVTVIPVDNGGNKGDTATRSFTFDNVAPKNVSFNPASQRIANNTHVALSQNEVWAAINDARPDYTNSTIEVRYNGGIAGSQKVNASTTALVWDLYSGDGGLANDQSHDGRYDITVVPRSTTGNIGNAVSSFFSYDSVPPVVTQTVPSIVINSDTPVWFGLGQSSLSITVSDSPKDAIQYGPNMPTQLNGFSFSNLQAPGDASWYNGTGSGVNITNSSFTWTMGTEVSNTLSVTGMLMSRPRPSLPADTSQGVADVVMRVNLLDRVNDGNIIPNSMVATYVYKFDYLAPQITISKPTTTDNTFCKNVLTVEGTVRDQGNSGEVMVKSIEYSIDNGTTWTSMPNVDLPNKNASFSCNIDITGKEDGNYVVSLRATDLGDNTSSETSVSYTIDRTPGPGPSLIVPLPSIITNKRGQLFKWALQATSDRYLLQISDDGSFNNILNSQTNDGYPGLVGQVLMMTEGAFSVPKDGTYYWHVASLENCTDGYLLSAFSETRSFTVDTVKPMALDVQPSPSQGNKVTTGMVTFTIRFSELVDTTISPLVKLTTAGGQMMVIEKVSYLEDTWIGTTVIPKNSSALYDGTAIITIENGTDYAGNLMAVDSTKSVIINTGPAFTTRLFSNPANEYELMIVTKASEALQGPPICSVQQSSTRTPVTMNFLKERFYAGSYKIDLLSPGKAYIDLSGTDLYGMVGNGSVEFTVADLSSSQRLDVTSISGLASLKGAEGSGLSEAAIYMLDRDSLESPFVASSVRASVASVMPTVVAQNGSELIPVMALEEIGPISLRLKKRLLYTAKLGTEKISLPSEKVHLYRLGSDGKWVFQGGEVKDGEVSAQISGLGRMALMADMTAPTLREQSPAAMQDLEDSFPEIKGLLADSGSGLRRDTFRMFINGLMVPGVALDAAGNFSYKVKQALPKGKHEVSFEVDDLAGNNLRQSFWVTAPGTFALDEFMPYPNPATGNAMYFNYNFNQTADTVRLRIYDTAGHKVADFETSDFVSTTKGRIRWDMRNDSGKAVANGVYFYQLNISKGGQTFKKRGKIAVMR